MVAPMGLLKVMLNASLDSYTLSLRMVMVMVLVVSPAAKLTVPVAPV